MAPVAELRRRLGNAQAVGRGVSAARDHAGRRRSMPCWRRVPRRGTTIPELEAGHGPYPEADRAAGSGRSRRSRSRASDWSCDRPASPTASERALTASSRARCGHQGLHVRSRRHAAAERSLAGRLRGAAGRGRGAHGACANEPFRSSCSPTAAPTRRRSRPRSCASSGLPVDDAQMFTPSSVAAEYMSRHGIRRVAGARQPRCGHALDGGGHRDRFHRRAARERGRCGLCRLAPGMRHEGHRGRRQAIWARRQVVRRPPTCRSSPPGRAARWVTRYAIVGAIRRLTKAPVILTGKPSLHALRFVAQQAGHHRCATWAWSATTRWSRSSWRAGEGPRRWRSPPA